MRMTLRRVSSAKKLRKFISASEKTYFGASEATILSNLGLPWSGFPQWVKFEARVVNVTRYPHQFLKPFDRAIVFTDPGINLGQAFQRQRAVVDVFRNRHQIDGVLCF